MSLHENVFPLQVLFHENQTHFHMKSFAQGLVLKQRHNLGNLEITYCRFGQNETI